MREWLYYAVKHTQSWGENSTVHVRYSSFYVNERLVRMTGARPEQVVPVKLVETTKENSSLVGWISEGCDFPTLIQPHKAFYLQFPGSVAEEEKRGHGVRVWLTFTETEEKEQEK